MGEDDDVYTAAGDVHGFAAIAQRWHFQDRGSKKKTQLGSSWHKLSQKINLGPDPAFEPTLGPSWPENIRDPQTSNKVPHFFLIKIKTIDFRIVK